MLGALGLKCTLHLVYGLLFCKYRYPKVAVVRPHEFPRGFQGWLCWLAWLPSMLMASRIRELGRLFGARRCLAEGRWPQIIGTVNPCVPGKQEDEHFVLARLKLPLLELKQRRGLRPAFLDMSSLLGEEKDCNHGVVSVAVAADLQLPLRTKELLCDDILRMVFLDTQMRPWMSADTEKLHRGLRRFFLLAREDGQLASVTCYLRRLRALLSKLVFAITEEGSVELLSVCMAACVEEVESLPFLRSFQRRCGRLTSRWRTFRMTASCQRSSTYATHCTVRAMISFLCSCNPRLRGTWHAPTAGG